MSIDDVLSGKAQFAVVCGDATAVMATLPDGCASVTYTDPPYGLSAQSTENIVECLTTWLAGGIYTHKAAGFMGSSWDAFTPGPEVFREVHRALRPGGYCVAFSSTRTVDLLGIAVRLAGFEMREGWSWVFGGSMPKSLNVSKAIDTSEGAEREVTRSATRDGNAERNGEGSQGATYGDAWGGFTTTSKPVTDAAIHWEGYGTTTKPAFEPIIVARKALDGTVAHNVQTHGCGALNIDAARIGTAENLNGGAYAKDGSERHDGSERWRYRRDGGAGDFVQPKGRFPAALALVHDEGCVCEGTRRVRGDTAIRALRKPHEAWRVMEGRTDRPEHGGNRATHADPDGTETVDAWRCTDTCAVAELGRQSGESASSDRPRNNTAAAQRLTPSMNGGAKDWTTGGHADVGTAARFFYQAKASARDRLAFIACTAGCVHHETVAGVKAARDSARDPSREHPHGFCRACGAARDHYQHPTVKPLDLARYHARLLSLPAHTRPIALVPFCGTGIEARALLDVGFRVIAIDLDPRHCAMTTFRLTHKEPEHVTEERAAVTEAERGDWTKPIRVSEVVAKATVPSARKEQLPLFGAK